MLQDIYPHRYDIGFRVRPAVDGDYVILLRNGKVLFNPDAGTAGMPTVRLLRKHAPESVDFLLYLFSLDDIGFYYSSIEMEHLPGFDWHDIMAFRDFEPQWLAFAGVTGSHLGAWHSKNRFCGCCGSAMEPKGDERALKCGGCGEVVYPRISPAVIVAVTDGDRLLMTRYANRPGARMALVAGFMEVGETFEDTVRREVMEEVGVRVKNLRYYKSQPWAFSGSVLVGFFADLDGAPDITMDTVELQEAVWFDRKDIPLPVSTASLTAEMVELFRTGTAPLR